MAPMGTLGAEQHLMQVGRTPHPRQARVVNALNAALQGWVAHANIWVPAGESAPGVSFVVQLGCTSAVSLRCTIETTAGALQFAIQCCGGVGLRRLRSGGCF